MLIMNMKSIHKIDLSKRWRTNPAREAIVLIVCGPTMKALFVLCENFQILYQNATGNLNVTIPWMKLKCRFCKKKVSNYYHKKGCSVCVITKTENSQ